MWAAFYLECSFGSYSVSQQRKIPKYILIILGHLLNTNTMTSVGLGLCSLARKQWKWRRCRPHFWKEKLFLFTYWKGSFKSLQTPCWILLITYIIVIVKTDSETIWQKQIVITTSSLMPIYIDYLKASALHVIKRVALQTKITIIV